MPPPGRRGAAAPALEAGGAASAGGRNHGPAGGLLVPGRAAVVCALFGPFLLQPWRIPAARP